MIKKTRCGNNVYISFLKQKDTKGSLSVELHFKKIYKDFYTGEFIYYDDHEYLAQKNCPYVGWNVIHFKKVKKNKINIELKNFLFELDNYLICIKE